MNFHEYLNRQMAEDRRAFIIHYPAATGKTDYAQRICKTRDDAYRFDFQQYWLSHPELEPGKLDLKTFEELLLGLQVPETVVIIDNLDILFNVWSDREKKSFLYWLKVQLRSPSDTDKTIVFVLQTDSAFIEYEMRNSQGDSRILPLDSFEAL